MLNPLLDPPLDPTIAISRPFSVRVERFDTTAHTISAVTLVGHPLAGWRYWRVFSAGTNDVVIETGAVDTQGPGIYNWAGFYIFKNDQIKCWWEYLQFSQKTLGAKQGSNPARNIVNGEWGPSQTGHDQNYILKNVCNAQPGSLCN